MKFTERTVDAPGGPIAVFESADVDADLNEAIKAGLPAPYGRILWTSAPVVADVVSKMALAGKVVVELGCGTGLISLIVARQGANVIATDVDAGALAAVAHAAAHGNIPLQTAFFDVKGAEALPSADIYIAADLIYEAELAAALARRVLEAKKRRALVVVGDPGRIFRDQFVRILAERGVDVRFVGDDVGVAVI